MTNRQQHIEAGAFAEYGSECRAMHHFIKGAQWADNNPSEETISRIVALYKKWYSQQLDISVSDYIRQQWNT